MNLFKHVNYNSYIVVTYYIESLSTLKIAAENLAIGQSVGNPSIRNEWETDELFEKHACKILEDEKILSKLSKGVVKIAFPLANIDLKTDGITQLLVQIMGGQLDIDDFKACHILDIDFPKEALRLFLKPKYGIKGIRNFTKVFDKPLLGGIIKPKIGISPDVLLKMVKQMVEGGVNFIKEDEIMANPSCCKLEERVPLVMDYLKNKRIIYAVNITSDYPYVIERANKVYELGGNAVHVNFWNGLGVYKTIRELDLPLFLFFQKSGDKILTDNNHKFHIDWKVICKLAGLMGVDFIHAGMLGGYSDYDVDDMLEILSILRKDDVMPSLSCGMHPGLVNSITKKIGIDYMANTGGAIHGHPNGTKEGAMAMRQAIDNDFKEEFYRALRKWGVYDFNIS